jgi:hypothetical protein
VRGRSVEGFAALGACALVALLATGRLLRPEFYSEDALVHQYWMWQYKDPLLFTDGLTAALRGSERYPDGYELLFRVATAVADPIAFGEWLGVALMALSGLLVFLIVREHTDWRPAAWIAALLFLLLIDIHRFYGGFPRAFVHPVVLLTVLLSLRGHGRAAALVAAGGALFYPPAALLAVGVLLFGAVAWRERRIDRERAVYAGGALVLAAAAVLVPSLLAGDSPRVMTAAEARAFPEFGEHGPLHFFVPSAIEYLRQNRSGFDLRTTGSILLLAAAALLLVRPANLRLLRREVLALPVVSLAAWAVAQAVLFRLYLPHRYTYPLVAFGAIAVGVALRPTWEALWARPRPRLRAFAMLAAPVAVCGIAVYAWPLGPTESLGRFASWRTLEIGAVTAAAAGAAALLIRRPAAGALLTGVALVGLLVAIPDRWERGTRCPGGPAIEYLATIPKDAVIAGDPNDLKCLPATARRPVVISTQLAPSYEPDYFRLGRERMFATLRAYYGPSAEAVAELGERYGATVLWLRRGAVEQELRPQGSRWKRRQQPYGRYVRELVAEGEPAVLDLPQACLRWSRGGDEVYDVPCVADAVRKR